MAAHDKRPVFRKAFLTYFTIFFVLIMAATGAALGILKEQQLKRVRQGYRNDAEKVVMMAESQLSQLLDVRSDYANARWVNKLSVPTDTFDREFDTLARMEYSDMLLQTLSLTPALRDIAILMPQKDLAVSQKGWFSTADYRSYLRTAYDITDGELDELQEKSSGLHPAGIFAECSYNLEDRPCLLILQSIDPVYASRGMLLLIAEREKLAAGAMLYSGLNLAAFILCSSQGQPVLERRTAQLQDPYVIELSSDLLNFSYRLEYPAPESQIPPLLLNLWLPTLLLALLLALSAGISYLLAHIYYRPLRKVVDLARNLESPDEESGDSEYAQLESAMHGLYGEARSLQRDLDFYYRAARNDFLIRLLRGCFGDDAEEGLTRYRIPFRQDAWYTVLLMEQPLRASLTVQEQERLELSLCAERFFRSRGLEPQCAETVHSDLVFLLSFDAPPEAGELRTLSEELRDTVFQECQLTTDVYAGDPYPGILGVSKSYQELEPRLHRGDSAVLFGLESSREEDHYYCPTDWQMQLIKQLKLGSAATVRQILDALEAENRERPLSRTQRVRLLTLLAETLQRAAGEAGLALELSGFECLRREVQRGRRETEDLWKPVRVLSEDFCRQINDSRQRGIICADNPILEYVNQHYSSPDMSLKEVGSRFSMSVSSVSKAFKECTNMNFYDYVTGLRMEKAKELLAQKVDVSRVARSVGYENDYSFRRAFQRYEKMKPSDWARKSEKDGGL